LDLRKFALDCYSSPHIEHGDLGLQPLDLEIAEPGAVEPFGRPASAKVTGRPALRWQFEAASVG
jgi:hypothetical protein